MKQIFLFMAFLNFQNVDKRVVAVYTANAQNPLYLQQLHLLDVDNRDLKERDVVIERYISVDNNEARFRQQHIKGSFTITLTGKDGGEKFRSDKPVTAAKLFAIIDAMPMCMEEMKARHQ